MYAQVWDWDPEKKQNILLIDADPLLLVNDPQLNELIENLDYSETLGKGTQSKTTIKNTLEFAGYALLKILEILIEVLF